MHRALLSGTGVFTPPHRISNDELVASFNEYVRRENARNADAIAAGNMQALSPSSGEFIEKASGIRSRYVMDRVGVLDPDRMAPSLPERPEDALSIQAEMSVSAARDAIARAGCEATDIDLVIVACSNTQRPYPAIAIEVQHALGIREAYAYDMNVACSSATFGIQNAVDAVRSGSAKRVLMVNPEICSGHLDFRDRDCHFIFGDVCTAVVIEREDLTKSTDTWEIVSSRLRTAFSNNIRNDSGFLDRWDGSAPGARHKLFHQEGRKVFKEVCPLVAAQILEHLDESRVAVAEIRRFWLHQANLQMNALNARRVLGRDPSREEAPVVLDEYANTSSAGSIIAFHQHHGDLEPGTTGVLCSFGAGYSIGSVILRRRGSSREV
jgi:beta-ketodecanoyl-[acyl-carrier-protein] synthase